MDIWEKAELARQEVIRAESVVLMNFFEDAKNLWPNVNLRIVVDNDCWHMGVGLGLDLSEDIYEDIYESLSKLQHERSLDCGPRRLAQLLIASYGFEAGSP